MIDYEHIIDVIEALGFESAWGGRDWVGDYHREDLYALAQALHLSQIGQVSWRSKVARDPFRQDYEQRLEELMITPKNRGSLYQVAPSYYTYRPSPQYLLDATLRFYQEYLPDAYALPQITYERTDREFSIVSPSEWSDGVLLATLNTRHEYENGPGMRAALTRLLCQVNESLISNYGLGARGRKRDYFTYAMAYIDELWGVKSVDMI